MSLKKSSSDYAHSNNSNVSSDNDDQEEVVENGKFRRAY